MNNLPNRSVTVRPGVGMLALFPSMNYKPWYAIGEFVDNAIQSWHASVGLLDAAYGAPATLHIDVDIDRNLGTITVTDNAAGIAARDIPRAFTPAEPPADASGLSQFGIGMKSAACWYAERFVVTTTALGEPVRRTVSFDVPQIVESRSETIPLVEEPADPSAHGTTITLSRLNHSAPTGRTLGKIRAYLSSIYRTFLRDERVHLVVAGERLRATDAELLVAPRWNDVDGVNVTWRKDLRVDLPSGRTVSGWAGLLSKGSTATAGFALLYRGKVVQGAGGMAKDPADAYKPVEVFGQGNTFTSQRLVGELDVSEVDVTHTKDALVWDGEDEEAFLAEVRAAVDSEPLPLIRMASGYRVTERGRAVQSTVRDVVESVARAADREARDGGSALEPPVVGPPRSGSAIEVPAPAVEERASLDSTAEILGESLVIRVVDDPSDRRTWLRVARDGSDWIVSVNRSHRFTESFAHLPGMDLEPILRLAVAIALSQIKAERSGAREPRFLLAELNRVLDGPLADRSEA